MSNQMQCMEVWGGNVGVERHFHVPGLDVWLYARPHQNEASGGDVYYVSSCASGRITRLLLADVSGHGTAVSESAKTLRDLMRRHVNSISQSRFVESLNQEFARISEEGRFATAVVGTFFTLNGRFQLCRAGHPPMLMYRHRTATWEVLSAEPELATPAIRNTPIGVVELAKYVHAEFPLERGDLLFAYTDGLTESRSDDDRLLGTSGLLELIRALDANRPEELLMSLLTRLRELGFSSSADDLTVLLVRADGTNPSWKNNLLAPLRLLRHALDSSQIATPDSRSVEG